MKPLDEEKDWIVEYRNFSGKWKLSNYSRDSVKYTKKEAEQLCERAQGKDGVNGLLYRARKEEDMKLKKHSLFANQKWTISGRLNIAHLEEILHVLRETGEVHIINKGEVPSLSELILDELAKGKLLEKEVWRVEFLRGGEWAFSNDFRGEYRTKEEAERAYSQATNGCTYRAVRK